MEVPTIVKAEILWTRKCPLKCSYCGMVSSKERAPSFLMCRGVPRLKERGCRFAAIYGASPFYDFEGLPEFVRALCEADILSTVIVDGISASLSKTRFLKLYDVGLRSLTVSYDGGIAGIPSVDAKSRSGLALARWALEKFDDLRDVELISTVTRRNISRLMEVIPMLVDEGFWYSFDLIHPDRHQPGSKCRGASSELVFEREDAGSLSRFAEMLLELRGVGGRIHQSVAFLEFLRDQPLTAMELKWNCTRCDEFPGWVTIDCDGTVRPCDDFCDPNESLKVWELTEETYLAWIARTKAFVLSYCPGCLWSTHWDALAIKRGDISLDGYVHIRK